MQPFQVPLCFLFAWAIVIISASSLWGAVRDTVNRSKQMHQIPCANCQFFTRDYHLKCTVHPSIALSEEAINCTDFEPPKTPYQTPKSYAYR